MLHDCNFENKALQLACLSLVADTLEGCLHHLLRQLLGGCNAHSKSCTILIAKTGLPWENLTIPLHFLAESYVL